ncbi:MAG TPA: protoporphyrinogen oxidase [Gemmatimonadales bacterium]|nr:protoporphyrinogen oxidase [Gemmatimonadales bacterium]
MTIAVVGAGLTGLAAAWELERVGRGADVVVLHSERHAGGVIVTERRDGFVVEGGPDGFLAAEPDIQDLAREVEIGDRVVDQVAMGSTLWTGSRLEPLREGRAAELLGIQLTAESELARGFRSFAGGMAQIVEALVARLAPRIRSSQGVMALAPGARGRGWRLSVTGGAAVEADAVVLAVPAWEIARLLAGVGVAARALDDVVYAPSVTVSLAYRAEQVPAHLEGTGFVAAAESGGAVTACTYAWRKFPHRAPDGHALLRAFVGPVNGDPGLVAHAELTTILGLRGPPLWTRAFHWPRGLPRYDRGHADRLAALRAGLARLPPLAIAGAGVDGAGVSACVRSGREAARTVLSRLASNRPAGLLPSEPHFLP